jgi:hypothetical protein
VEQLVFQTVPYLKIGGMNMEKLTIEEWKEIGDLAKQINNDLNRLTMLSQKGVGTTRTKSIKQSTKYLNRFRSVAENVMLSKGIGNINVFYGNQSAEE